MPSLGILKPWMQVPSSAHFPSPYPLPLPPRPPLPRYAWNHGSELATYIKRLRKQTLDDIQTVLVLLRK